VGRRFNFEFNVFSREAIVDMTNDELKLHISQFRKMIREARNQGKDTLDFETEFCYLDQECQYRQRAEKIGRKFSRDNREQRDNSVESTPGAVINNVK